MFNLSNNIYPLSIFGDLFHLFEIHNNSSNEEPIYIEMTKATSSLNKHSVINNNNKPKHNEYMDMDVVQSALSNFKFN